MTEFGTLTRLPRYDWNTLQPIRQRHPLLVEDLGERPIGGTLTNGGAYRSYGRRPIPSDLYTVPRVSQQWAPAISPLAVNDHSAGALPSAPPQQDLQGTVRTLKTPYAAAPMAPAETPTQLVNSGAQATSQPKFDWEERLFENYHIGVHRLVFLVRRFPALAALVISVWTLFGRKQTAMFPLGQQETNQNVSVFVTAVVTLIGVVLGVRNHGNEHRSALQQIISRLGSLTMSLIAEITTFVFGLIAIINLSKQSEQTPPDCYPQACFSLNNRIVQSGIQLGITLLSIVLSIVAIFHGVKAVIRILYDRKVERRALRRNRELASYSNPLVNKSDLYF